MPKIGRAPTPAHERALEMGINVLHKLGWTIKKVEMARPNLAIKGQKICRVRSRGVKYFKKKGWRIIPTRGTPDAIGIKNGVIAAIESLKVIKQGWQSGALNKKRKTYAAFDKLFFILFRHRGDQFEIFIRGYETPKSDIWSEVRDD